MITAVVGAGGKTSLIKELAAKYRAENKTVFITTSTRMFVEEDTLCTDDAEEIIAALKENGCVMAGIKEGQKIRSLSEETYHKVCGNADVVLVEADGSKHMPLKVPNATEPVIPENADEILVVCGLHGLGQKANDCCHRLDLVKALLGIDDDTVITPHHVQKMVTEGYVRPLSQKYPDKKITVVPRHNGTLYQKTVAVMLTCGEEVSQIKAEWFLPQPKLIVCGGGHVGREVAEIAAHLDFSTRIIDDRAELMTKDRFPNTEDVVCDSYDHIENYLEPGACYVIVTPDYKADYRCLSAILPTDFTYLGMIGSKKKVAAAMDKLREDDFDEAQIGRVFAPIGLAIHAVTPAEIAISILAQIIQEKSKTHTASADRELLEIKESGVLCVITEKQGSAPRGVGSMMFVGKEKVLGSIGGGESENQAIEYAQNLTAVSAVEYTLNNKRNDGLDMVCGGTIRVLMIPV